MKYLLKKLACIFLFGSYIFFSCRSNDEINIIYPGAGSPYSKNINSRDSNNYFLPIRHLMLFQDTFLAFDVRYFFQGFEEENLSLSPPREDIFRFTFDCGFCGKAAVLRLTKNEIILKKNKVGYGGLQIDLDLLSSKEREHYRTIELYYPFTDTKYPEKYKVRYKVFFDSLIRQHPQLLDRTYFEQLRAKASIIHKMSEGYIEQRVSLTKEKFKYFVTKLNESGFWQRSERNECVGTSMDGDGFTVEAATKEKYHIVNYDYCKGDDDRSDLRKMINELLNFIHFDLEAFYVENFPKNE